MSKLIPFALAGVGSAAASVGGVYLIKGTSAKAADKTSKQNTQDLEFGSVDDFRKKMSDSKCVKEYFSGLENPVDDSSAPATSPTGDVFFKASEPAASEKFRSCLKLEYKTNRYQGDKWDGKFTWTWTFVRGDEGFINFNVAETDDKEEGKLKFSGIFYLVGKKDGQQDKWEIKYKKQMGNDKKADSSSLDNTFPKASSALSSAKGGDYWGFMDSKEKLKNICKDSDCKKEASPHQPVSRELAWEKGDSNAQGLAAWSGTSWWTGLYESSPWSLATKTSSFKGTWK